MLYEWKIRGCVRETRRERTDAFEEKLERDERESGGVCMALQCVSGDCWLGWRREINALRGRSDTVTVEDDFEVLEDKVG